MGFHVPKACEVVRLDVEVPVRYAEVLAWLARSAGAVAEGRRS